MANKEDIERFLNYIKQIESSGGTNTDHPLIQTGIHAGDAAQGEYGMMPNTMEELAKRSPASFSEESTPEDYAHKLAGMVLNKAKGDETLAAGLWNQGHNSPKNRFNDVRNSIYGQKYDKLRSEIPTALDPNPYQQEISENPDKYLEQLGPVKDEDIQFKLLKTRLQSK